MKIVIIHDRQTLFDIAIQYCGDREAAFEIADVNDLSITEELSAGTSLEIADVINQKIVDYYRINSIVPATAVGIMGIDADKNGIISNDEIYIIVTNNDSNIQIIINNG